MPSQRSKSTEAWSMYPLLHDSVSRLLEENNLHFDFHDIDDATSCTKEYDTNIMGRFICRNHTCSSDGWSSKRIAITIRMYPGAKYNGRAHINRYLCEGCRAGHCSALDARAE
ncbi:hypothetical protein SS1G_02986 [Sclerotinia sclerotiorum 1980 UF-70]|uniref:3CxxC-type domain-containing protein n=1 Tax=Sclerotinia sclerotiorum (strain ATCC 18683 / 1980 / Ss-1) TaxID=665079 RepID=A7ECE7_SCLS1|nr:hypothetical protein SS1G_02986 [Sclerotinia sclerotiorum 1980 UF-70]EDO00126.1 hypothetical protein SS1G_02986 [Sclerotinia sclerotiorum 1980 UF-70]